MKKKAMSRAMLFILLFGIVSMFSDMTKESAESIRGAFLSLMGASAATIFPAHCLRPPGGPYAKVLAHSHNRLLS